MLFMSYIEMFIDYTFINQKLKDTCKKTEAEG